MASSRSLDSHPAFYQPIWAYAQLGTWEAVFLAFSGRRSQALIQLNLLMIEYQTWSEGESLQGKWDADGVDGRGCF
jgi:hypothetical protein